VVVGGGLLGLSAAWALARRGTEVVVLETGNKLGHERSGSKGDARIFRLGYPERHYVEMAMLARDLWSELETRTGRTLLHVTGQVTFGAEMGAIVSAMEAAGAPVERLSARDADARFPDIAAHAPVLFEPDSGVLAAGDCLRALCDDGAFEVRTGVCVTSLHDADGEVSVRTATGEEIRASVVVDCAGPAALSLVPSARERVGHVAAAPSLPQVAYFRALDNMDGGRGLPVFIEWGPHMIYGLPLPNPPRAVPHAGEDDAETNRGGADRDATYKVSHHTQERPLVSYDPSETGPMAGDDPALVARLRSAVARLLPGLDPEPVATERCVYDNTRDSDFVIDRVGRIVLGCGTSGHGFKFGPLLGELLADLAMGVDARPHTFDRSGVELRRFALGRAVRDRASPTARRGHSGPAAGERR
jgi:sarcosine oxidase